MEIQDKYKMAIEKLEQYFYKLIEENGLDEYEIRYKEGVNPRIVYDPKTCIYIVYLKYNSFGGHHKFTTNIYDFFIKNPEKLEKMTKNFLKDIDKAYERHIMEMKIKREEIKKEIKEKNAAITFINNLINRGKNDD